MRKMSDVGLWSHATFGPLLAPIGAAVAGSLVSGVVSKVLAPKAGGGGGSQAAAPSAPRPPTPMNSSQTSFFGPNSSTMGGTFVTGNAGKPNLGGASGKKTLLGA